MRGVRLVSILGWLTILVLASATAGTASASSRTAHRPTLAARQTQALLALIHARSHGLRRHGYLIRPRARSSIVGGTTAVQGTWGFMAFVVHSDANDNPDFWCSGTLVAPNVVLTAGHCATDESTGQPLDPSGFQVVTGAVDFEDTANAQLSRVSQVVVNQAYDPKLYAGDAALLVLKSPSTAPTIRLARTGEQVPYTPGRDALIAGWGIPYAGADASSQLQVAPTNVQGPDYCELYWDGFDSVSTWDTCAAQTPPIQVTATCNGDSGGPLLTDDAGGEPVEVGLTSVGPADCAPDRADYFTRTDVISNWVDTVTASVSARTTSSLTTTSTTPTSTTTTTTTSTTTTKPAVKPPPVGIAKVTLPTLTLGDARSYAATMVRARTHARPRLALSCRRINQWAVHCSIHWQSHASAYAVSGRFFHYLQGNRAYWWYDFTGTRRWKACRVRHHHRACTAYVQRFRWS